MLLIVQMKFHLGYNDLLPKGIPIMTREIVVGDVHGCVDELGILIDHRMGTLRNAVFLGRDCP